VMRNILFISSTPINTRYNRLEGKSEGEAMPNAKKAQGGGVKVYRHSFSTSALDGGEWSSRSGLFTLRYIPGTH
jgi:hypothetical protein